MKKRIMGIVAALSIAAAGCGGAEEAQSQPAKPAPATKPAKPAPATEPKKTAQPAPKEQKKFPFKNKIKELTVVVKDPHHMSEMIAAEEMDNSAGDEIIMDLIAKGHTFNLYSGARVTVLEADHGGKSYRIRTKSGKTGYIYSDWFNEQEKKKNKK